MDVLSGRRFEAALAAEVCANSFLHIASADNPGTTADIKTARSEIESRMVAVPLLMKPRPASAPRRRNVF
jgi:hypothetical protein